MSVTSVDIFYAFSNKVQRPAVSLPDDPPDMDELMSVMYRTGKPLVEMVFY